MTIDEILDIVEEQVEGSNKLRRACVCLLVADNVSADPSVIYKITGYDIKEVKRFCDRWSENGVIGADGINRSGWIDADGDLTAAFMFDSYVAIGSVKRLACTDIGE